MKKGAVRGVKGKHGEGKKSRAGERRDTGERREEKKWDSVRKHSSGGGDERGAIS